MSAYASLAHRAAPSTRAGVIGAALLVAGFGAGVLTQSTPGVSALRASASPAHPTAPVVRLVDLGFAPGYAERLLRQLDGIGLDQRFAAERIALATEWSSADAFGPDHSRSSGRP